MSAPYPTERRRRPTLRWSGLLAFAAMACTASEGSQDLPEAAEAYPASCVITAKPLCDDCLKISRRAQLGKDPGEGFLEDNGTLSDVVVTATGDYWVGQRDRVKLFNSAGRYLRTIGRAGEGPQEFKFARPFAVDPDGTVWVADPRNLRYSTYSPSGEFQETFRLPAPSASMKRMPGDGAVLANIWLPDADHIGLPLHIIQDGEIVQSFGLTANSGTAGVTPATVYRLLAIDGSGRIFAARRHHYLVEAWRPDGTGIMHLQGPTLNDGEPIPGTWSPANPPRNQILALAARQGRLFVLRRQLREGWRDSIEEKISATGRLTWAPEGNDITTVFASRIDVISLRTCSLEASTWYDGMILNLLDPQTAVELDHTPLGAPVLNILSLQTDGLDS